MGNSPASILAGLAMVGATLVGCESSRPYQGNRIGGSGAVGSATPAQGWNSSTGVAGRPTGSAPVGTAQPMPAGQYGGQGQQPVAGRQSSPGAATVGSGAALGSSQYQQPVSSVNERPATNPPAWSGTAAPTANDRVPARSATSGIPVSNPGVSAPRAAENSTSTSSRLSAPMPAVDPAPVISTPSRSFNDVPAPLPQGASGAPVIEPPPPLPAPGR